MPPQAATGGEAATWMGEATEEAGGGAQPPEQWGRVRTMDAAQQVQELIDAQVADGRQIGVQVAAYLRGEPFVSAVAGTMGPDDTRPVEPDSLFLSFSTTKGVAALAVHQLVDRGQLDLDAPVATYWPEFAANGKERVLVRHVMSHTAGVSGWEEPVDLTDRETSAAALARRASTAPKYASVT